MYSLHSSNILKIVLLCLAISSSSDIDFFSSDICDKITCEKLSESDCNGGYVKKLSSLCGCGVCVKYVGKGEKCDGIGSRVECKGGLTCDKDGKCTNYTKCEFHRQFKKSLIQNGTLSEKSWLPDCTTGGAYRKLQFVGSKAICVDNDGKRLFGQEQKEFADNMTCECSYYLSKKKEREKTAWANGPIEHCNTHGNFESLQCVDNICYCADQFTGKPVGLLTPIKQWKLLPCYDAAKHGKQYERNCEKEMFRINLFKHQFAKKGIRITGITGSECEADGTFSPKQCLTNLCYCVDEKGYSFDVYKAEKSRSRYMDCRCAMDKYLIQSRHIQYPDLRCDDNGNYYPLQYIGGEYFCSDGEGGTVAEYKNENYEIEKMMERCMNISRFLREKIGVGERRFNLV